MYLIPGVAVRGPGIQPPWMFVEHVGKIQLVLQALLLGYAAFNALCVGHKDDESQA